MQITLSALARTQTDSTWCQRCHRFRRCSFASLQLKITSTHSVLRYLQTVFYLLFKDPSCCRGTLSFTDKEVEAQAGKETAARISASVCPRPKALKPSSERRSPLHFLQMGTLRIGEKDCRGTVRVAVQGWRPGGLPASWAIPPALAPGAHRIAS